MWRKGSFLLAFSDFFNLEAFLINCVYCPKHSETKAGNGWIPVSLCLCFSHTNPHCEYTHTPQDSNLWGVRLCKHTHTHAHTQKTHTKEYEDMSADKKTFRRCERELREAAAAAFSFLCTSPSHTLSPQGGTSPLP